jgi:hypothetical protein
VYPLYHGYVALMIARDRVREADEDRRAALARQAGHDRPRPPAGPLRRALARSAAAVSRGAARVAVRLGQPSGA